MIGIDELLELLACPQCHKELAMRQDKEAFVCTRCNVYYTIRDGIPVLIRTEAERF